MDKIIIKGLEIFAYHGVNPEEKRDGQPFVLDVTLQADLQKARQSDGLEDTVNYAAVRKAIHRAFTAEKYDLIERAAQAVCDTVLAEFPQVEKISLTLKKPQAPMNAVFDYVAVEVEQLRELPCQLVDQEPLHTQRLVLRPFTKEDGPGLYAYLSDPETVRFEPYEPFTREQAEEEARRRACDPAFWAVCDIEGRLLGNLYFAPGEFDTWELGYVFNRKYWGNGYAAEAAMALLGHGFAHMGVRRVTACCNPENVRSWRLLERLGLRREGHLQKNVAFFKDGQGQPLWQDTYEYGVLREEWGTAR